MAANPHSYAIGVDLGGTNLRAAAIDSQGSLIQRVAGETDLRGGREAIVAGIVADVAALRASHGVANLAGIGVAVPGFISLREGIIRNSNNLSAIEGFPIRDEISKRLGARVILENDANAASLGEKWIGSGRQVEDLVMLTLGTGVGGGIISGGKVLRGFLGMAGELGHMTVYPDGNPCGCGNRGCLEKHASATAIIRSASKRGLGENLTARNVYDLAINGNPDAAAIFADVGEALGIALANLVNTFNFPLYLIGGGVIGAWDLFAPAMLEEIRRRSFTFRASETRLERAGLAADAGLYGAAALAFGLG